MDIDKIFENIESELLTEDVKKKISTLIEAKITEKSEAKTKELEGLFEEYKEKELNKLEEKAVAYVDEYLVDKIDEYMEYVSDEYMKENKLEVESGLKSEMYDKIISGVKGVLSENQIKEEDVQESEEVFDENKKLKEDIDKQMKENIALKKNVKAGKALSIFNEVVSDLSLTEKEKMKELASSYDVDDVEDFKEKLNILKESISSFSEDDDSKDDSDDDEEKKELNESFNSKTKLKERDASAAYDDFGEMMTYL